MSPTLAVLIVSYNAGGPLERCLASLPPALAACDWEAIVVDNASADDSAGVAERAAARLAQTAPDGARRIRVVRSPENLGFGVAVNRAAALTRAPWLLLLNPDAALAPGVCEALIAECARYPETAAIGPGILNEDGSVQGSARGDPSWSTAFFGRTSPLTRWFPNSALVRRSVIPPELAPGETSRVVDWVSGACVLLRHDAFDQVGGFDPAYFLYWEDADLCRRLRMAGYSVRYQPGTWVRHEVGASSRSVRGLAARAFYDGARRYYGRYVARTPLDRWALDLYLRLRAIVALRQHEH